MAPPKKPPRAVSCRPIAPEKIEAAWSCAECLGWQQNPIAVIACKTGLSQREVWMALVCGYEIQSRGMAIVESTVASLRAMLRENRLAVLQEVAA